MKLDDPRSWIHPQHCECSECTPYSPAVPPAIGGVAFVRLGCLGFATGVAAAGVLAPLRTGAAIAALLWLG